MDQQTQRKSEFTLSELRNIFQGYQHLWYDTEWERRRACEFYLMEHGYKRLTGGAWKTVLFFPNGKYVVKFGESWEPHSNGTAIRRRYLAHRKRRRNQLLPPLLWGPWWHVQKWVQECKCYRGIPGYDDSSGHNHTHIGRRTLLFDY